MCSMTRSAPGTSTLRPGDRAPDSICSDPDRRHRHPAVRPVPWAPVGCFGVRRHRPANRQCANPTARQRGAHLGDRRPGPRCAQGQGQHHTRCVWRHRANHIPDPSGRLRGRDRHDRRRRHRARHVPASALWVRRSRSRHRSVEAMVSRRAGIWSRPGAGPMTPPRWRPGRG
jgi:hypothetical protein